MSTVSNRARAAGAFYLMTFITGMIALRLSNWAIANVAADLAYIGVTVLFYQLFAAVDRRLSLLAALFSFAGCLVGVLQLVHRWPFQMSALPVFGIYCILIGLLIVRSDFLPHWLGVLMIIGGVSWMTFAYIPLARALAPYNYMPGIIAEGLLTFWLLVFAVDAERWRKQKAQIVAPA